MKKNILVIDDDKAIRNSFVLTFEDTNYKIDTAPNGKAGLEKILLYDYDVVFLDLKMPEMNGVKVLEEINRIGKNILVYIITAFHQEFFLELETARSKGHQFEILQKPLNSEQLKNVVDCILGQY
jgi:DNA-binding NtrC family response regulator